MDLSRFLGNRQVKEALCSAFSAGRFPHAIVLQGDPGCGKRTLALLIAQALVCRDKERAPCGACPSCVRAAAGSHPDIRLVEGSGTTRSLTVAAVKEVIADAYRRPEEADYSVYLLFLGEKTLPAAQNKLLKLIEEPPEGAVFLLVCQSAEQLLPTIRSRAQCFTLRPPEEEEAAAWLAAHKNVEPDRARDLAALCGGNLGRMQDALRDSGEQEAYDLARAIARGVTATGEHALLAAAAPLQKDRKLCREVLTRLSLLFRDAYVLREGGTALLGGAPQEADKLGDLPKKRLMALCQVPEDYLQKLDRNANMALLVTCLCVSLRQAAGR